MSEHLTQYYLHSIGTIIVSIH